MECVICGGVANKVTEKRKGYWRKETVVVEAELYRCEQCGEGFLDPSQMKAHTRAVKNEIRKKYGLLPPERVAEIRKRLGLTQADLEHLLNTGPKVVVRWESGKVIQSVSHDNVLRLLDRHPELLGELREVQEARSEEKRESLAPAM